MAGSPSSHAPARQRVLSFVGAQVPPAPRQDESRLTQSVIALHQGDSDSGPLEAVRIECRRTRERHKALGHQPAEACTERVDHSG